ncbi:hypothetical protein ATK23_0550 [Glutamicibacter mysorens]|uniref:Uncharacterized protein n=1 Tax=Glutamicibacter mysorens TaxID=257984 RepID=A0ABX4MVY5_9MICC|nr:hypothetical protein ATK23_0550 [Glutamicibacter mysorens]
MGPTCFRSCSGTPLMNLIAIDDSSERWSPGIMAHFQYGFSCRYELAERGNEFPFEGTKFSASSAVEARNESSHQRRTDLFSRRNLRAADGMPLVDGMDPNIDSQRVGIGFVSHRCREAEQGRASPITVKVLAPPVSGTPLAHASLGSASLPAGTFLFKRGSLDSSRNATRVVIENAQAANSHANIPRPKSLNSARHC